jgi:hypothetical protein
MLDLGIPIEIRILAGILVVVFIVVWAVKKKKGES